MTPFVWLSLAMAALAGAWLTHPLWRPHWRSAMPHRAAAPTLSAPGHHSLALPVALALFIVALAAGGYAWVGSAGNLDAGPNVAPATAGWPRPRASRAARRWSGPRRASRTRPIGWPSA